MRSHRGTLLWGVAVCALVCACGKVESVADSAVGPSTDGAAASSDARVTDAPTSSVDAPTVDAMFCANNAECSNNVFCDGAEVCQGDGMCGQGTPPDCGMSDVCFMRYCDTMADDCAADMLDYNISYSFTSGSSGAVTMTCGDARTVETINSMCPTGAPVSLQLICQMDSNGGLRARTQSSNTACLPSSNGPVVSSNCSTIGTSTAEFSCCWP